MEMGDLSEVWKVAPFPASRSGCAVNASEETFHGGHAATSVLRTTRVITHNLSVEYPINS